MKHKKNGTYNKDYKQNDRSYRKIVIILISTIMISLSVSLLCFSKQVDTQGEENVEEHSNLNEEAEKESIRKKEEDIEISMQKINKISKKVSEIVGDKKESYGIFYYDINSGLQYTLNSDVGFHAASTIKVPIAMMIADKLDNNEITKDTKIKYEESDNCDGAGELQGRVSKGDEFPVIDLLKYMIEDSDNIATSMLKKSIGSVSSYIYNLTEISMIGESNFITPRQSGILLKKIYEKAEEDNNYRDIINLMLKTNTHDRLDKKIPKNMVAHKIGDYENYVNDIGVIYSERPYILCIYTKDVMEEGRENIADISKVIYDITLDKL
ncbi:MULTISPECIES: serine hydrolase [Clostridium]|uniref:Serine hydrolase n=1 Tax=Clostridium cibarium TaxID=2762247 RepID=A0ABR8PR60_9CLOT|nr:serine hydrolase [Clostridium sp. HBUAS56017]MBD7910670.1 serine hydrolase [Clostridium cibarium]